MLRHSNVSHDVKLDLFRDFKLELFGAFIRRFTAATDGQSTKINCNRLHVALNNAYRRILDLP